MNFVKQILDAGFIERGQKRFLEKMPHKANMIPKWWENYPYSESWFGLTVYHPDAWFIKDDDLKTELTLSLQGLQMAMLTDVPKKEEDKILMAQNACKYIRLKKNGLVIYETFSGEIPPQNIIDRFLAN